MVLSSMYIMKRMVTKEFKEQIDMIYEFINKKITNLITL